MSVTLCTRSQSACARTARRRRSTCAACPASAALRDARRRPAAARQPCALRHLRCDALDLSSADGAQPAGAAVRAGAQGDRRPAVAELDAAELDLTRWTSTAAGRVRGARADPCREHGADRAQACVQPRARREVPMLERIAEHRQPELTIETLWIARPSKQQRARVCVRGRSMNGWQPVRPRLAFSQVAPSRELYGLRRCTFDGGGRRRALDCLSERIIWPFNRAY